MIFASAPNVSTQSAHGLVSAVDLARCTKGTGVRTVSQWKSALELDSLWRCGWNVWRQQRRVDIGIDIGINMSSASSSAAMLMLERGSGRTRLTSWTLQRSPAAFSRREVKGGSGRPATSAANAANAAIQNFRVKATPVKSRSIISPCQTAPSARIPTPRAGSQDSLHQEFHASSRLSCWAPNGFSRSPGLVDVRVLHNMARSYTRDRSRGQETWHGMEAGAEELHACKRRELL